MGLFSESSCKFLGDARPDLAQGHCPRALRVEARLPPCAAAKLKAALAGGADGGPQGNEPPLSHSVLRSEVPHAPLVPGHGGYSGTGGVPLLHPSSILLFCF